MPSPFAVKRAWNLPKRYLILGSYWTAGEQSFSLIPTSQPFFSSWNGKPCSIGGAKPTDYVSQTSRHCGTRTHIFYEYWWDHWITIILNAYINQADWLSLSRWDSGLELRPNYFRELGNYSVGYYFVVTSQIWRHLSPPSQAWNILELRLVS